MGSGQSERVTQPTQRSMLQTVGDSQGSPELSHAPAALQVSVPLQKSPSSHAAPGVGVLTHPVASQESAVQGLPSSHAMHEPSPQQTDPAAQVTSPRHDPSTWH
jgi:hypothetical protein